MMGHQHALGGAVAWMAAAPAPDATYGLAGGEMVLVARGMLTDRACPIVARQTTADTVVLYIPGVAA